MPGIQRQDPLPAFRFMVEKEGRAIPQVTGVTGLVLKSGLSFPDTPIAVPLPCPNIVLQRGVTADTEFWDWVKMTLKDRSLRYDIRIVLMDAAGNEVIIWRLVNAYPVRWCGPDLFSDTSAVAFETLELGYDRIEWENPGGTPV
jgi:hypothetical protein